MTDFSEKFLVWKSRLLDTSRRNRLLHFTARRGQVTVLAPTADEIFEELVNKGRKLTFVPRRGDSRDPAADQAEFSETGAFTDTGEIPADAAASSEPIAEVFPLASADESASDLPNRASTEIDDGLEPPIGDFSAPNSLLEMSIPSGDLPADATAPTAAETTTSVIDASNGDSAEQLPRSETTAARRRSELLTGLSETQLTTTLYNLRSNSRTALEEQGVNVLFLSFGMLHWTEPATRETVTSPLLLVPVQLERTSVTQPFTLQVRDEDILLNPTLTHKLYIDFRIQLPRLPDESENLTPRAVFDLLHQALAHLPAWRIAPDVHLELFSFEKLVMLRDLEAHEQEIAAHPILQALAGDPSQLPPPPTDLLHANELDDKTQPLQVFQVLDADSSQQVAIEWAKRGLSFVIEGPPGTGKSQTIANIIAEVLAQGKKVLFVSAKMAALEVVAKRLAQCGLANFYLEAHSHHTSRGVLVSELGRTLNEPVAEQTPAVEHLAQLGDLRGELNGYARALHTSVAPLEQTPFHAYAVLASVTDAPDLYFEFPDLENFPGRQFDALEETLDNLTLHADVWEGEAQHPWRGVALPTYTFKARTDIEFRFGELIQALTLIETAGAKLADALTLPAPQSLQGVERLSAIAVHALETPTPPTAWFRAGETAELNALALDAQRLDNAYAAAYAEYSAHFTDALMECADLAELLTRLKEAHDKPLRIFDAQYRRDMRIVRTASKANDVSDVEQAIRALFQAQALQNLKAQRAAQAGELAARFGRLFNEQGTDWDAVLKQLDWVDQMVALFAPETVPESFTNLVCNRIARVNAARPAYQDLQTVWARGKNEWDFLTGLFPDAVGALYADTFSAVRTWLGTRLDQIGSLETWLQFQHMNAELRRLGAGAFLESARAAKLQGDQLKPAFLKRFYLLWLDVVYARFPVLQQSDEIHRKRVTQFWRADVEQLTIARERLAQQLAQARPVAGWSDAPSSEVTLLKREMAKRKHHKSIRRLASEIPNLLLALKPCLMMSPLSVSQYLASAPVIFDLVIFDEASQIPPEEAVAAVVRAKQIIVAGDHQQLPPTPFFQTLGELEDEEWRDTNVLESLLQEAAIVLPSVRLMWHYRSRHEALLGFSNHYFYEDRLVTFPNAAVEDARLGVEFIHVPEGVYDRAKTRTNPIEAQRVAALVLDHFTRSPERSLGVVTFSQAQRAAIDLELQNSLREHPELENYLNGKGNEPFFCKSLENVQGDERDVMFFSVGYGKDANGVLTMNFGPLNGQDGARRLNVAITRAREQVKLVSSFLPADLDITRTNSRGVQLLRAYMDYAAKQGRAAWVVAAQEETRLDADEQELRNRVQDALTAQGFDVRSRIGSGSERIDLALVDAEDAARYALGIELDGEAYHHAHTARERERLRVQVLEQLGWKIYRLRARDWLTGSAVQVERIAQMVSALDTPADAWVRGKNSQRATAAANGNGEADASALVPTGMAVYVPVQLPRQGTPEQFFRAEEKTIQDLFVQLAEQEGPLHWNAATRRIAACWGIPRVTPAVEEHLDGILSTLIAQQRVLLRDDFLWSPVTMDVLVRQPAPGAEPRPIEEIALEEITKAAYLNLKNALSLTEEDWVALTARLLGYPRASERVKRRILTALTRLETGEIVKREDGKYELK